VTTTHVEEKSVPVTIPAVGTAEAISSVQIRAQVTGQLSQIHFAEGQEVKEGDLLFTLDNRAYQVQLRQAQAALERDKAQLQRAMLELTRQTELANRGSATVQKLEDAQTAVNVLEAAIRADEAASDNARINLEYTTIRAPITGRISMAAVKVGNFVRQADPIPLATIIQSAPVYVTFALPQRSLPDLRQAMTNETAMIESVVPGDQRRAQGHVTMIENTVDAVTGTVPVRATMPNTDELLWPGTLVSVLLTLREEDAVTVPSPAVQVSQTGSFVFVVKNNAATVQPVKVARTLGDETILESGLEGGETVVTEGHLLLTSGARVAVRTAKAGS